MGRIVRKNTIIREPGCRRMVDLEIACVSGCRVRRLPFSARGRHVLRFEVVGAGFRSKDPNTQLQSASGLYGTLSEHVQDTG